MTRPGGLDYGPPTAPRTPAAVHFWLSCAMGTIVALAMFVALVPVMRDIGTGLVLAAGSFVLLRAMEVGQVEWPAPPSGHTRRTATTQRWRLSGFESMVEKNPGFSPQLRQRLQVLATAILTRNELVPGSPGAIALLGLESHDILYPELLTEADRVNGRIPDDEFSHDELAAMTDRLIELSAPTKGTR